MGINELITRKTELPAIEENNGKIFKEVPIIKYSLVDSSRYVFEYKYNDDIEINMFESDRTYDSNDFIDAEFENEIGEKDHSYFAVAAASGVLTGMFSRFKLSESDLKKIREWKNKDWEKYILIVAQLIGYNKSDVKGAVNFIKDRFVPFVSDEIKMEFHSGAEVWLKTLSNHPSIAGLVFSILSQFSEERYQLGEKNIEREPVPEYYAIGRNLEEKIVYGLLYWVFTLSIDVAVSKFALLDDMRIPKEVVKLLKVLLKSPIFANIPKNYDEAEMQFSEWIKHIFEKSEYVDEQGESKKFDLKSTINELNESAKEYCVPVIINECLVRAFYFVKKLSAEIRDKEIHSFTDLNKVEPTNVLPFNNRLISRMILISSGCFVGVNVAGAVVKAIIAHKKGDTKLAAVLLTQINVAGVGRFVFACIADSQYWSDDIKAFFERKNKKSKTSDAAEEEKVVNDMFSNDAFKTLSLTPAQTRALYSLESLAVIQDINHTDKPSEKEKKQKWLDLWQKRISGGFEMESSEFFVTDEKAIYDALCSVEQTNDNLRWFYLLTAEFVEFKPYYPLGSENDSEFKKLHREKYNYVDDQFARRQIIVSQAEIDAIRDNYKKYKGIISGSTQNTIVVAGVAAVAAVATGGLAFAFAPGIATLIAGEAVMGLHGAALASASLAFVGGGSLAAGGLGMAGGTAIITGGGALLGIAGSGSASMAVILTQTSSEYWIRQSTKLLTFCKCVLKDKFDNDESILELSKEISLTIGRVERNIKELEEERCSLDKDAIKNSKECLKYLNKCRTELDKLIK